jgi:uroporphyrinogen decarboxylase
MTNQPSRFLRACQGEPVDTTPIWFMRQAGRYMKEYRSLREQYTFLEVCQEPELIKEVTMQPIRRFDLDAAILFADILLPLKSLGLEFDFTQGEGPKIAEPVRKPDDVKRLQIGRPEEDLKPVFEAIRLLREELPAETALIGFAGAPFTVASYIVEGGKSKNFSHTKQLMYGAPEAWGKMMEQIVEVTTRYLEAQIQAGVQAVQLFDSWVGCLDREDYRTYVLPYTKQVFGGLQSHSLPMIHFGTGTATLLELMQEAGGTVLGVDWRISLEEVWGRLGDAVPLQGNLDPVALLGPANYLEEKVNRILQEAEGHPAHIFNLGHGILPQTPLENVDLVIRMVRERARG